VLTVALTFSIGSLPDKDLSESLKEVPLTKMLNREMTLMEPFGNLHDFSSSEINTFGSAIGVCETSSLSDTLLASTIT